MPMSAEVLGPLIQSKMDALTDEQKADRAQTFKAMAEAFIQHVSTAAQITGVLGPGLATPPGGGVVAGTVVLPPGSIT
jgi:hypothetical protein